MNETTTTAARAYPARRACRVLLVSALLALVGCMDQVGLLDDDPLRGGRPIPTNATTTPSARAVSDGSAPVTDPAALPSPNSPTSPAALVSGAASLPTPPPVASPPAPEFGVKVGGPLPVTSSHLSPVAATSSGGEGGVVQASAVASAPVAPTPVSAPASTATSAATDGSYEQLQQMLLQHGVTWQQLKTGTAKGEWVFRCTIPDPHEKNVEKHFEAHAVGPFGLNAIRTALKDIDDDEKGK